MLRHGQNNRPRPKKVGAGAQNTSARLPPILTAGRSDKACLVYIDMANRETMAGKPNNHRGSLPMKAALDTTTLKRLYARLARHYDLQHGLITARSDQRGRRQLVELLVGPGDRVLDCGAGTGSTGILAACRVGAYGHVTLLDLSDEMLEVAWEKVADAGLQDRVDTQSGDMQQLPFADNSFDVALSTYSLCPIADPAASALELYRVTRPGGMIGIAHSTQPDNPLLRWLADKVKNIAWRLPWLSMGCRAVNVRPALEAGGGRVHLEKHIGIPLWPFQLLVIEKPADR